MNEKPSPPSKSFSPDWLMRGVLTKLGDTFDRFLGRGWKPSSSLATSELIEKLKQLLDNEVRVDRGGKYVPNIFKLKMQWDKFSTDADDAMKKLETELLAAAVDHINDRHYYTYGPLSIEAKPDYFTTGVKLSVSFGARDGEHHEAEMDVSLPGGKLADLVPEMPVPASEKYILRFDENGKPRTMRLTFDEGRRLSIGRTKENDITVDDPSLSKVHASLVLDRESNLKVADTGSTNGTFVRGERIPYGKALTIEDGESVVFGAVSVAFEHIPKPIETPSEPLIEDTVSIDEFEFRSRTAESAEPETEAEEQAAEAVEPAVAAEEEKTL